MNAIFAIARNDLRLLLRDKTAAFFTFAFPLLFALFFTMIFHGGGDRGKMGVAVLDEDGGKTAAGFVADLSAETSVRAQTVQTRGEGLAQVRKGDAVALVVVPKGFGVGGMFSGGGMKLEAVIDPSREAEMGMLTGKLNELAFRQLSRAFTDTAMMKDVLADARARLKTFAADGSPRSKAFNDFYNGVDTLSGELERMQTEPAATSGDASTSASKRGPGFSPVQVQVNTLSDDGHPHAASDFAFPQGVAWALMSCITGFAAGIAVERRRGTLIRLSTSPMSRGEVLAGKALAALLSTLLVQTLLIGVAVAVGSKVGSWPLMAMAVCSCSLGFVGMSMALASFASTEEGAGGIARAVPMILTMIGGGTIPLFLMPAFMQTFSSISPFKWAILAVEGAMWRGFTPMEMLLPCSILLGVGAVCFAVGARRLKFSE